MAKPPSTWIVHHASIGAVDQLFAVFAKLTPGGWEVPDWLHTMRATALSDSALQMLRRLALNR